MSTQPSHAREAKAWLAVVGWSLLIFVTIPVANAIQAWIAGVWGPELFIYGVAAVVVASALGVARGMVRRGSPTGVAGYLWLTGIAAVFAAYVWALPGNPVESVHFVEYGVLGALLYRALRHRIRDATVYVAAALLAAVVGIVDEAIQWLTPGRYWDLGDVWLNFTGAALTLLAIAAALRPPSIAEPVRRASVRRLLAITALLLTVITVSLLNTPPRIAWYTRVVPARGVEVGAILRAFGSDDRYAEFLARQSPVTDPFAHEVRVHLFLRDRFLARAHIHPEDPEWYPWHASVAHRENLILERWFPRTLAAAGAELPAAVRATLARDQDPTFAYESRASEDLVTAVGERSVIGGMLVLLTAVVLGWRAAGVRRDEEA